MSDKKSGITQISMGIIIFGVGIFHQNPSQTILNRLFRIEGIFEPFEAFSKRFFEAFEAVFDAC